VLILGKRTFSHVVGLYISSIQHATQQKAHTGIEVSQVGDRDEKAPPRLKYTSYLSKTFGLVFIGQMLQGIEQQNHVKRGVGIR
jgi:hypothetical protein